MTDNDFFSMLVPTYFEIGGCEIIIIQDSNGDLLTLKIIEYDR